MLCNSFCGSHCLLFLLQFAFVAAVRQELRHPPQNHGYHHHGPVAAPIDPEAPSAVEQPALDQEEVVDDPNDPKVEDDGIEVELEDSRKVSLKSRQEETEDETKELEEDQAELGNKAAWVDCDFNVNPKKSCYDCQTRMICKYPRGGKLVGCNFALRPYCNNGICSSVPGADCA